MTNPKEDSDSQRSENLDTHLEKSSQSGQSEDDSMALAFHQSIELSGPIPAPELLERYERLLPGTADRLIKMAEREQNYQQRLNEKVVDANIADKQRGRLESNIGQVFGLVIGLTTIIVGAQVAVKGAEIAGALIGTSGVAGLVSVFVLGKDKNKHYEE